MQKGVFKIYARGKANSWGYGKEILVRIAGEKKREQQCVFDKS
jgi:hypothetical protein